METGITTVSIRLTETEAEVISFLAADEGLSKTDFLLKPIAEKIRLRLESDPAHPISPYFTKTLSARGLFDYFGKFLKAKSGQGGYRLMQVPAAGFWQKEGIVGWAILQNNQEFTESGILTRAGGQSDE